MTTQARIDANRANARKSTGPKTPEGKSISARNAKRHGLCSTTFVVDNEDFAEYMQLRTSYVARFGPRDRVEMDLVDRMVHAQWNLVRTWTMQNETINLELFRAEGSIEAQWTGVTERTRTAMAFEELAKKPTIHLLNRYEARQSNEYNRALKTFNELRKTVPLAPPGPLPPQPEIPRDQTNPTPGTDNAETAENVVARVPEAAFLDSLAPQPCKATHEMAPSTQSGTPGSVDNPPGLTHS